MAEKNDEKNEISKGVEEAEEKSKEIYKEIEALLKYTDKNIDTDPKRMQEIEAAAEAERQEQMKIDNHIIAAEQYLISLYNCTSKKSEVKVDENGLIA